MQPSAFQSNNITRTLNYESYDSDNLSPVKGFDIGPVNPKDKDHENFSKLSKNSLDRLNAINKDKNVLNHKFVKSKPPRKTRFWTKNRNSTVSAGRKTYLYDYDQVSNMNPSNT